jgi:hypothetical protein
MPALDGWKEAAFVGYFGPIGKCTILCNRKSADFQVSELFTGRQRLLNTCPILPTASIYERSSYPSTTSSSSLAFSSTVPLSAYSRRPDQWWAKDTLNRKTTRLSPFDPAPRSTSAPRTFIAATTWRSREQVPGGNQLGNTCHDISLFQTRVMYDQMLIDHSSIWP